MPEPRYDLTLKVENVSQAEVDTIVRLLHSTGYPAEIADKQQRERRVSVSEED